MDVISVFPRDVFLPLESPRCFSSTNPCMERKYARNTIEETLHLSNPTSAASLSREISTRLRGLSESFSTEFEFVVPYDVILYSVLGDGSSV
jgi:hypothetical protein